MRKVRYVVAMSLDGFIAGPNGEADWITMDPEIDFAALFHQFDTILLGRRTFEGMMKSGRAIIPGMKTFVFSRTLPPDSGRIPLSPVGQKVYKTGLVTLEYRIDNH